MKYVVVKIGCKEQIFVFPRTLNHDSFAEVLSYIKLGNSQRWRREFAEPVSAGFIDGGRCYGESETLNLRSRGDADTSLLLGVLCDAQVNNEKPMFCSDGQSPK